MGALGNSNIDKWDNLDGLFGPSHNTQDEERCDSEEAETTNYVLEKNGDEPESQMEEPVVEATEPKKSKKGDAKEEKPIHSKTVKFTDTEEQYLQDLKLVIGTDRDTKAIRWCVGKVIEAYGEEIRAMAKKKRKIGTL